MILAAALGSQAAVEDSAWQHGALTLAPARGDREQATVLPVAQHQAAFRRAERRRGQSRRPEFLRDQSCERVDQGRASGGHDQHGRFQPVANRDQQIRQPTVGRNRRFRARRCWALTPSLAVDAPSRSTGRRRRCQHPSGSKVDSVFFTTDKPCFMAWSPNPLLCGRGAAPRLSG